MSVMRIAMATIAVLALWAPVALAHDGGEGTYGPANDKVVTNAGFILIAFFPLFIFTMSMIQWGLERRKDRRKAAHRRVANDEAWRGGW